MLKSIAIENAIAPLATRYQFCANELLTIWEAAREREHPGKSIACFFKVMGIADRRKESDYVQPLKEWLETHVEIVAEDEEAHILERCAVQLDSDDLETFCNGVMSSFHQDRSYETRQISLRFEYKADIAA